MSPHAMGSCFEVNRPERESPFAEECPGFAPPREIEDGRGIAGFRQSDPVRPRDLFLDSQPGAHGLC
jgi:hypothetical protein